MANLLKQADIATDGNYVRQIQQALVKTALAVVNEDAATKHHAKRLAYANRVLMNPGQYAQLAAYGAVTVDTMNLRVPDIEIESVVNIQFNAYALDQV